jgi:hypothetical protein
MPGRARPGRQLDRRARCSGGGGQSLGVVAEGGDDRVRYLAGGDDGVQVTQDRGRDDRLRGLGLELVGLPAGQVLVAGPADRVRPPGSPDRALCCQAKPGPALSGELGPAGEGAGQFLPRRQPRVPVQRAGGGEPARVARLGQDRGSADRGQAGDRGDQAGQPELVQHGEHPGRGVRQPPMCMVPVLQEQRHPLQRAGPVSDYPGRVGEGGEQLADDPQARPAPAARNDQPPGRGPGPGRPSRRVRPRSPPSRSVMTGIAAVRVAERNGCRAVPRLAGHAHSSSARICWT